MRGVGDELAERRVGMNDRRQIIGDRAHLDSQHRLADHSDGAFAGSAANRVKYTVNGFVIAVGAYVKPVVKQAKTTARKLGKVDVDMGGTACKVPLALEYIEKIEKSGRAGKKRKTIRC